MDTLAEPILERDKERGGGIVVTMPTTSDAVAVQNRPAPSGNAEFSRLRRCLPAGQAGSSSAYLQYAFVVAPCIRLNSAVPNSYYLREGQ